MQVETKKVESPKIIRQNTMPVDTMKVQALMRQFKRKKLPSSKRSSGFSCNDYRPASSTESDSPDVTGFVDQKSKRSKRKSSRVSEYRTSIERLYEHVKTVGPDLKPALAQTAIFDYKIKRSQKFGKRIKIDRKPNSAYLKPTTIDVNYFSA